MDDSNIRHELQADARFLMHFSTFGSRRVERKFRLPAQLLVNKDSEPHFCLATKSIKSDGSIVTYATLISG